MNDGAMNKQVRAAAIQLATKIADSAANIAGCERLAGEAVQKGAQWIALPEFFTTGVAWDPRIADAIETESGPAATFLRDFSARHCIVIGGSFLCRISDGTVRNRYMAFANGTLIGRHDKDLPTMWENAFYEGGDPGDIGVLGSYEGARVGAAVCWEFMRTMTAQRLRSRVDVIMGAPAGGASPPICPAGSRTPGRNRTPSVPWRACRIRRGWWAPRSSMPHTADKSGAPCSACPCCRIGDILKGMPLSWMQQAG